MMNQLAKFLFLPHVGGSWAESASDFLDLLECKIYAIKCDVLVQKDAYFTFLY